MSRDTLDTERLLGALRHPLDPSRASADAASAWCEAVLDPLWDLEPGTPDAQLAQRIGVALGVAFARRASPAWRARLPEAEADALAIHAAAAWVDAPTPAHAARCAELVDVAVAADLEGTDWPTFLLCAVTFDQIFTDPLVQSLGRCAAQVPNAADAVADARAAAEAVLAGEAAFPDARSLRAPTLDVAAFGPFATPPPPSGDARLDRLAERYGVVFPREVLALWELARGLRPDRPRVAFEALGGLRLVGPFDVLAGDLDAASPAPLLTHCRFEVDPFEVFTIAIGGSDGEHYGYVFDDPRAGASGVSRCFARDDARTHFAALTLFDAIADRIDAEVESAESSRHHDPDFYAAALETFAAQREALERQREHAGLPARASAAEARVARAGAVDTPDGLGLVLPVGALASIPGLMREQRERCFRRLTPLAAGEALLYMRTYLAAGRPLLADVVRSVYLASRIGH
ncbi:MAG: DUF2228 domain-containing protein [Sandaracinaceae bacterium]